MNISKIKKQAILLSLFVFLMIGLSYASVPLYDLFCKVTGYGGTPMIAETENEDIFQQEIVVRLDSSIKKNSPLFFEPTKKSVKTKIGKNNLVFFKAINRSQNKVVGTATFNVTPLIAAKYFNKIECFCFEEQLFSAGEEVEMPVSFFIDPDIMEDKILNGINEMTLSYTMYLKNNN